MPDETDGFWSEWIDHDGGDCPVRPGTMTEIDEEAAHGGTFMSDNLPKHIVSIIAPGPNPHNWNHGNFGESVPKWPGKFYGRILRYRYRILRSKRAAEIIDVAKRPTLVPEEVS